MVASEMSVTMANSEDKYESGYSAYRLVTAPEENTEEYPSFTENTFKSSKTDPLSTFSLDVDAASYGNMRRMINNGQMPDKNSVRVEELINYFSYKYEQPSGKDPVKINTEVHPCPWNKKNLLLRIGVKAKEIPSENLPASNFVFLLDVSGSMDEPNKLPLVKSSIKLLTNNLRGKDRVAIVVYAGAAGVVLESTSGDDKQKIQEALNQLQAGGSTAGGDGIELAYKIAQKNFISGGNNRIILCTDGDFNVGVSSDKGLEGLIEAKRKTGVFLTVLGFGMGNYKDSKLQILAQKGNGNHAYIDNIQEANKVLVNEFGSTMYAVAKDVKLQVEFNPTFISSYRLVGYETRLLNKEDFNDDTKDAGELGAGHTVTAFYELVPTGSESGDANPVVDDLRYQKNPEVKPLPELPKAMTGNEICFVKLRYKPIGSDTSIKMETPVKNDKTDSISEDYSFASAVAMFGQLVRNSDFKGDASYEDVLNLANKGIGNDKNGYRHEFVRLVQSVNQMSK
jgi:Ca-activated chloride channel family protein